MSRRFKLDENVARDIELLLRGKGHDVRTALDQGLGGGNDDDLIAACRAEERILITLDLDFADVREYPPKDQPGTWVLRPPTQSVGDTLSVLRDAVELADTESPANRLWIVQRGRVRVRQ